MVTGEPLDEQQIAMSPAMRTMFDTARDNIKKYNENQDRLWAEEADWLKQDNGMLVLSCCSSELCIDLLHAVVQF